MFKPIVSDPEHFDDYGDEDYEDDYDFIAPFNGNGKNAAADKQTAYEGHHAENEENDLIPRSFEDLKKKPKKKQPVKKPIEETSREPNSPWL